ncbi:fibronectin type III domain-containing protein [Microbacterium sp. P5_E9]
MTDYDKRVGSAGTMRIRDTGSTVEYWILCSDGATFVGGYTWSGVVNGSPVGGTTTLNSGFRERLLGSWGVSGGQTVTFHQNATGTSGLGGAADHSAYISRYTPPPATAPPDPVRWMAPADQITPTSARISFGYWPSSTGGTPLTAYDCEYGTDPTFAVKEQRAYPAGSNGLEILDHLKPGTKYYVRMRANNAVGHGPWSVNLELTTTGGISVSDGTNWSTWVVDVSDGTKWVRQISEVSDGTAWKVTG